MSHSEDNGDLDAAEVLLVGLVVARGVQVAKVERIADGLERVPVHAGHDGTNALGLVRHTPAAHAQVRALGQHLDANLRQLGRIARQHFLGTAQ